MTAEFRAAAAGRVNLIGDHTDYTGGLVMPMVLDEETTITGKSRIDHHWDITSLDLDDVARIDLPITDSTTIEPPWARYIAGVIAEFEELGTRVPGFMGSIRTSIPIGSGLSSSAALEVAVARLIEQLLPVSEDHDSTGTVALVELAQLCRRAEHRATGVPCGIMDQLSILAGRPHTATLIDCHELSIEYVDIPPDIRFTTQFVHPRTLADSAYAERVAQCRAIESDIGPLRSAHLEHLDRLSSVILRRRARHVITENQRVRQFAQALSAKDYTAAGDLMVASHWSLAGDYETSTPDMDRAVTEALAEPDVFGARMTGGGFGGCIVVLRRNPPSSAIIQ